MINKMKALLAVAAAIGLIIALNTKFGTVPPFGKLLNPFTGFWQNAEGATQLLDSKEMAAQGCKQEVRILLDSNAVPHIFAQNNHDLYWAQGYVTASNRLWQMEFLTHVASGRISEVVGDIAVEYDRYQRRIGMVDGAKASLEAMLADPVTKEAVTAYAEGVNAYITSLNDARLPIEYKILDYKPEAWTPLKTALLLKLMAYDLAGYSDDLYMTNILNKYGKAVVDSLFPNYPHHAEPIIPAGTKWDFEPLPQPPVPPSATQASLSSPFIKENPSHDLGSNNWAVNGRKTLTGLPILANDPHLQLNLPSIWYQVQLVSPDVNAYGASLPGAPSVISGFNQNIAWGVTNVYADVMDWYDIRFKDNTLSEYWHDGQWKKVTKKIETIIVRGKETRLDTILYTHHGPIAYTRKSDKVFKDYTPRGHALRWLAHDKANELMTFHQLNRAANYDQYVQALSSYGCPAQNFVFASNQNDIALWCNGKYPLKWKEQGKFLLDGSNPQHEWQSYLPHAHSPHVKNPPRNFVSSANQHSTDSTYPYYLQWEYSQYERGRRINERLEAMQNISPDSMRMLQNDNFNVAARNVLPSLLANIDSSALKTDLEKKAFRTIAQWNMYANPAEIGATIYDRWWNILLDKLWADDFGADMRYPSRDQTIFMIKNQPNSHWFDNSKTPKVRETLRQQVQMSFVKAVAELEEKQGEWGEKWQWVNFKSTDILHIAKIPGFNRNDLPIGGGSGIVNATGPRNGASWRMVVALGTTPQAMGIYPGGQSGNPGSPFYDNMINTWAKGELKPLLYLSKPEANAAVKGEIKLKP